MQGAAPPAQPGRLDGRKEVIRGYVVLGAVLVLAAVVLSIFPGRTEAAAASTLQYLREMVTILPAVMVIMGLFSVFVSKDLVMKHLGKTSRAKGMVLAILFGALPTGPLYVAFPLAMALRKKGASIANIVAFLSAWACIKVPQELFELQFLGFQFMITRLALTLVFVVVMSAFIEKVIDWADHGSVRLAAIDGDGGG